MVVFLEHSEKEIAYSSIDSILTEPSYGRDYLELKSFQIFYIREYSFNFLFMLFLHMLI